MNKRVIITVTSLALFIVGAVAVQQTAARGWFAYGQSQERTNTPPPARIVEIASAVNESQDGMDISLYVPEPYKRVNEKAGAVTGADEKENDVRLTLRERVEVMMALTGQKLYPEKAQLTAGELAAEARRRSAERENNRTGAFLRFGGPSTIRYEEMQEVFHRAYRMKVSDALELASRSIELLGI
jgi:hypothetical protein